MNRLFPILVVLFLLALSVTPATAAEDEGESVRLTARVVDTMGTVPGKSSARVKIQIDAWSPDEDIIHLVEVLYWNRRLAENPDAPYRGIDRPILGAFWDANGDLRRGAVGDADCRLFDIRAYVDSLLAEVEHGPDPYLK